MIVRPSRKKYFNSYVTAGVLSSLIPFVNSALFTIPSVLFSAFLILKPEINRARNKYIINGIDLIHEVGIFRKSRSMTRVLRVSQMNVTQGIKEKLLNYGTVTLETWGQPLKFEDVNNPALIIERIKEMQKDNELY